MYDNFDSGLAMASCLSQPSWAALAARLEWAGSLLLCTSVLTCHKALSIGLINQCIILEVWLLSFVPNTLHLVLSGFLAHYASLEQRPGAISKGCAPCFPSWGSVPRSWDKQSRNLGFKDGSCMSNFCYFMLSPKGYQGPMNSYPSALFQKYGPDVF